MPAPFAFGAFLFWYPAPTHTFVTGSHPDKLAKNRLAHLLELARPIAPLAGMELFRLASCTIALWAGLVVHELYFFIGASNCLFKGDLHPHQDIVTCLRTSGPPCSTTKRPAKKIENIAEARKVR